MVKHQKGGVIGNCVATTVILCIVFALIGGPVLSGAAGGIEGFGDFMRWMAGETPND